MTDETHNASSPPEGEDDLSKMLRMLSASPEKPGPPAYLANDNAFLSAFENLTMRLGDFRRHASHIRLAWLYITQFGFDEALNRVRDGITNFFNHYEVQSSRRTGYHETITVAWLRLVNFTITHHGADRDSMDFCDRYPHLLHHSLLNLFYSDDRLYSPEAKAAFVEPDLHPLPT